jgi:GGDEF domain-containing protein
VVPAITLTRTGVENVSLALEKGADEVVPADMDDREAINRLESLLSRSERDLGVHPSTRLPGASAIESEIMRRLTSGELFAVCYADLDHFKEYNDRYSWNEGDRVIRILAMILHDVVKGVCGERGFVGHIGGDDFIFVIPHDTVAAICEEITSTFDLLVPYQYSEPDRRAGYFFGKDRRGVLDRVPLMTLSIGVVTNVQRTFKEPRQVSRLATEMKTYAKTLNGSVYSVDRRTDDRPPIFEVGGAGTTGSGDK